MANETTLRPRDIPFDDGDTPDRLAEITTSVNELQEQAAALLKTAEEDKSQAGDVTKKIEEDIQPRLDVLTKEREEAIREVEFKSMQGRLETLGDALEELKKPAGPFQFPTDDPQGKSLEQNEDDPYGPVVGEGNHSVFQDIRLANKGSQEARERLVHGYEEVRFEGKALSAEGKALTEGVAAQGGYLVRPQVERQIVESRELDNVLRGLCSKINVNTNSIQLDQITLSATAGWVAELATKPESTGLTLASVTANVFTAAGLATVSNQLLADSDPAVDQLAVRDLTKRLVALEETAFINGSGTGQPLGLLNTPGLGATPLTSTAVADLIDAILDAIAAVETDHGAPSAILMHPRTWTRILKAKDAQGVYLLGAPAAATNNSPSITQARTEFRGPQKFLWGYPVVTSNRVPTNLGAGTNESRVVVGDFSEALILDRQGITVDESEHVYFTTNQTVFRAEERVGFTAARTPLAFNIVGGVGLANG